MKNGLKDGIISQVFTTGNINKVGTVISAILLRSISVKFPVVSTWIGFGIGVCVDSARQL